MASFTVEFTVLGSPATGALGVNIRIGPEGGHGYESLVTSPFKEGDRVRNPLLHAAYTTWADAGTTSGTITISGA